MFSFLVWTILNHEQYIYLIPLHWLHTGWLYNGYPGIPFCCGLFFLSTLKQAVDFYPLSNQMKPIYQPINQSINHHLSIVPPDFWVEPPIPNWWLSQSPITSKVSKRRRVPCWKLGWAPGWSKAAGVDHGHSWLLGNTWKYYLEILLGNITWK